MLMRKEQAKAVIIVDDEKMMMSMLESHFLKDGYQCATAISSEEALNLARQKHFDVMISNVHMPRMDGLMLMHEVKKLRPDVVVILMSGFTDQFSYDAAMEAGAADFMKKPFTYKELKARIQQAQLPKEISEMVLIDELTGLYNRRGFFSIGEHIVNIEKREKHGLFLLCLDLVNLKEINSLHGHGEGDESLRKIGEILRATYRSSDVIARIGGDEFAVMPVFGDKNSGDIIINRLRAAIENHNAAAGKSYRLSVHAGLAFVDASDSCPLGQLLSRAEKIMYEHKNGADTLPKA